MLKIGIIGGTGWIGGAMARHLLSAHLIDTSSLIVSNRTGEAEGLADIKQLRITTDNTALVDESDIVVLSIRPQDFKKITIDVKNKMALSVMAGVTVETIQAHTHAQTVIRTMPNAAIEIGESFTPWYCADELSDDRIASIEKIVNSFGTSTRVDREDDIDFFTALTGSGHGTVACFATTLVDAAVKHGIDKTVAIAGVKQLLRGMGELLQQPDCDLHRDVQRVIDYAGTTAQIVLSLQDQGLDEIVERAIDAGYQKAKSDMSE